MSKYYESECVSKTSVTQCAPGRRLTIIPIVYFHCYELHIYELPFMYVESFLGILDSIKLIQPIPPKTLLIWLIIEQNWPFICRYSKHFISIIEVGIIPQPYGNGEVSLCLHAFFCFRFIQHHDSPRTCILTVVIH